MMCLQFTFYNVGNFKREGKGAGWLILHLSFFLKLIKTAFCMYHFHNHSIYNPLIMYSISRIATIQQIKKKPKNERGGRKRVI